MDPTAPNKINTAPVMPVPPVQNSMNLATPPSKKSSNNTFFIIASISVIIVIVGITLFLYIQNRLVPNQTAQNAQNSAILTYDSLPLLELEHPQPKSSLPPKSDCTNKTVFTSIDQALASQEDVCVLALDNKSLTTLPSSILKLSKLKFIYLRGNKFDTIPSVLYKMPYLWGIDLSNNKISSISTDLNQIKDLEIIILKNNKLNTDSWKGLKTPLNFNLTVSL